MHSDIYFNLGSCRENLGDLKGAIKEWRKAAELGDEDAKAIIQKYEKE